MSISIIFIDYMLGIVNVKANPIEVPLSKSTHSIFNQNSESSTELLRENIQQLATSTTIRILILNSAGTVVTSGSGVIVQRLGDVYTALTNLHVLQFADRYIIITPDGLQHSPLPKSHTPKFGNNDMAIAMFQSSQSYEVAKIKNAPLQVGDRVFAAGFPIYQDRSLITTFDLGLRAFRFTEGVVSILPAKSLNQGYQLGYSNDIVVGMSGGPIFDAAGFLVGINGRIKNRDPDFGGYTFDDGTEPSPTLLQQMLKASWGVPISTYLQFRSMHSYGIGGTMFHRS